MANPLLPAGRTTPIAAYIGARTLPPFNLVNRTSGVDASNRTDRRTAAGQGVSSPLLGGSTTIRVVGRM